MLADARPFVLRLYEHETDDWARPAKFGDGWAGLAYFPPPTAGSTLDEAVRTLLCSFAFASWNCFVSVKAFNVEVSGSLEAKLTADDHHAPPSPARHGHAQPVPTCAITARRCCRTARGPPVPTALGPHTTPILRTMAPCAHTIGIRDGRGRHRGRRGAQEPARERVAVCQPHRPAASREEGARSHAPVGWCYLHCCQRSGADLRGEVRGPRRVVLRKLVTCR